MARTSLDRAFDELEASHTALLKLAFAQDESKKLQDEIKKAEKLLYLLENRPTLAWACVKCQVSKLKTEELESPASEKILTIFVEDLDNLKDPGILKHLKCLWQQLYNSKAYTNLTTIYSSTHTCLFQTFLVKCFSQLRNEKFSALMQKMILDSIECISLLCDERNQNIQTANGILRIFFVQILEPSCHASQEIAKSVLKTCRWKVADSVREMLNDMLVNGNPIELDFLSPQKNVYDLIYDLLLISVDLVLGLLNNIELCLMPGRNDRILGLRFLCKLFGEKQIPQIPNPADFFTNIWNQFTSHCREISLHESEELLILAKYTPFILHHKRSYQNWCSTLFHILRFEIGSDCEKAFVLGITKALRENLSYFEDDSSLSLLQLAKSLLTPNSAYILYGESMKLLLNELATIYEEVSLNLSDTLVTSQILHMFCVTLDSLDPQPDKWILFRSLFVKKLVPYTQEDPELRMDKFIHLWTNSESEWITLHELFNKIKLARRCILLLLQLTADETTISKPNHLKVQTAVFELKLLLGFDFMVHKFWRNLFLSMDSTFSELRSQLLKLFHKDSSCKNNLETCRVINNIVSDADVDGRVKEMMSGLLFYITESVCERESVMYLVSLLNDSCSRNTSESHVEMEEQANSWRNNFHLLYEILNMLPHLAYHKPLLVHLLKWSQSPNKSVSMHALRCFTCFASFFKLELYDPRLTKDLLLPVWINVIKSESRRQVKMAIKCVASHTTSSHKAALSHVLRIISSQLTNPSDQENFQRGVSALGHFALVCPEFLKEQVEKLCLSVLVQDVLKRSHNTDDQFCASSNNEWTHWEELPYHISIKVQALRSIGRCVRFCGRWESASEVLNILEAVVSSPKDGEYELLSDVDHDRLRYEAASALLNIFESDIFKHKVSKNMILSLSQLMTDPRSEVRSSFAIKLCQGLSPIKARTAYIGRHRGHLATCWLGLLALLGTHVWRSSPESEKEADLLAMQVCVSRTKTTRWLASSMNARSIAKVYDMCPIFVVENSLAAAVPILVEHPFFQCSDASDDESVESLIDLAECLQFMSSTMCGYVTKDYMLNMAEVARKTIKPTMDSYKKKYADVLELLKLTANHYKPRIHKSRLMTPSSIMLPPPFYTSEESLEFYREISFDIHSIERSVYRSGSRKNENLMRFDSHAPEDDSWTDTDSHFSFAAPSAISTSSANPHKEFPCKRVRIQ